MSQENNGFQESSFSKTKKSKNQLSKRSFNEQSDRLSNGENTLRSSLNKTYKSGGRDTKSIMKKTAGGVDAGNTARTVDFKSDSQATVREDNTLPPAES